MSLRERIERCGARSARRDALRWPAELTGERGGGVRVALLDSGLDFSDPVFANARLRGRDFTGSGGLGDRSGHGTANAALLVGRASGDAAGLALDCELLVAKVGGCSDRARTVEAVASALRWAVRARAQVIVMPFGSSRGAAAIAREVRAAVGAGADVFAAAGNRGADRICFPAWLPEVTAVSALRGSGAVLDGCCATDDVDAYCWGQAVPSIARAHAYEISGSSPATVLAAGVRALQRARAARVPSSPSAPVRARTRGRERCR